VTVTVNNLPDLIVLPTATYDPIAMTFSATVQNIGTSGTVGPTTVGVKYSVDGVSKTWGSLPGPIDINQTMILPQTGPAYSMPVGTHSVDVFVDDVNRFVESNEANNHYIFSVTISPPADTIPPSVPTGLIATPFSNTQVNLSWEASTDNVGVTGYTVWRDGVVVGSPIGLTFSDTGLGVCSSHNYQITAHDTVPNISAKSVTVPATTTGCTNADYDIQGFAKTANVTGGNGGTQITISSTSDANITGTLRYALGQTGSRYIKFAPGMNGTINNSTAIIIGFGNVTLDGAGANVDITGNSLYMGVNNIIIKNLRFPNTTVGYCAISVDGHAKNIWIDHNTFSNNSKNDAATGDPVCFFNFNSGAWDGGLTGSTISWNKFMEPNMKAIVIGTASSGPHGGNDAVNIPLRVSLHHNWYHLVSDRTPRIEGRTGAIHAWNNYHYWWEPQPGNPSPYPGGAVTTGDNGINFLSENDIYEAGPIDKATTSWNNYPASLASSLNVVGQWSLNGPTYSTVGTFPRSMIDYTGYPLEIANDALRQRIIAGAGKKL
jgi:pectate lyase